MRVQPVPALRDNYAYLVIDETRHTAAVVDPSEAEPVARALEAEGVTLEQVWLTHHHWDHVGGIEALVDAAGGDVPVLGSVYDLEHKRIPRQTRGLRDGDAFPFAGHDVRILEIPGHTLGAIAYVVAGHVFSGDTLFVAGCGRVFEGTMPMMKDSLAKLRALPGDTKLWCGHEYTVKNLEYARTVEPGSEAIADALTQAKAAREAGRFTVPGHLARELEINPFLRFDVPEVAKGRDPVTTFTALRDGKDRF
jgi:hydroxyacylglutathione hydrolase